MAGTQNILDLPQERVTGDILRGHGPRRGNLEALLRYWRPRMKLPGGFRRCLVTLADHPELYPLPNICAWLHHEVTGKWPNEGCHHPGMRNCRSGVRKVVGAVTPGKELPTFNEVFDEILFLNRKEEQAYIEYLESAISGIEVKAGTQNILDLPQERVTGDILRGHGPRRGNLEALLRYWRPRMKLPGGFRRCLATLADHPELYPLPNICAWLHHEVTGKWPNEGCHHPGMRNCRSGARRAIPGKELPIVSNAARWSLREARANGSALFKPLNGDLNLLDFKARGLLEKSAWGSFLVPGEKPFIFHHNPARSLLWNLATPGGSGLVPGMGTPGIGGFGVPGGGLGFGGGGLGGGIGGTGFGATGGGATMVPPAISGGTTRCPSGFEYGGRFTDKRASNCGAQLFTSTGSGIRTVGSWGSSYYRLMGSNPKPPTTVGSNFVRPVQSNLPSVGSQTIGGSRITDPPIMKVGPSNPEYQERAVTGVSEALSELRASPGFPVNRLVRRDGSILTPLVDVSVLARQRDNEDLRNGVFITWVDNPATMGKSVLPLFASGIRSIVFSVPGGGQIRMDKKGVLNEVDLARIGQALASQNLKGLDAGARLELLAALSEGKLALSINYPDLTNPQEKVLVEEPEGGRRYVPMWVYKMFLAEQAPVRPPDRAPARLVERQVSKAHPAFEEIDTKAARFGSFLSEARGQVQKKALRTPAPPGVR